MGFVRFRGRFRGEGSGSRGRGARPCVQEVREGVFPWVLRVPVGNFAISSLAVTAGHLTYNPVNPHSDGIDLDTVVGWLADSGEEIATVDDYDHWYRLFSDSLAHLPEMQRRHSLILLVHNYIQTIPPVNGGVVNAPRFFEAVSWATV